mgnify:CR=1 FL=1
MTPQELKNSILQLAIQGKLVAQRPEEGTAQELYAQIQAEKQRLIKEGKIKKEKPLPEIIEEEKPFEIPEGWMWVRLGNCGSWSAGATPSRTKSEYYGGTIPWLKTGDLNDGIILEVPETITNLALSQTSVRLNPVGSVLMAMYGATIGKLGILEIPSTTNQACCACIPYNGVYNKFLFFFLLTSRDSFIKMGAGGAQPNISKEKIVNFLMPLPPLAEQKRIVAKIEELLPLVDRYEQAWTKLEDFNRRFPEDMKKSILQQAIQGKLVEQRPEEGTAQELYEQIQIEKQRLIKEGKLKKEKPLPEITEEEKPFEIPEGWMWVRLTEIGSFSSGKTPDMTNKSFWDNGTVNWMTSKDMKEKYLNESQMKITEVAAQGMTIYEPGTLLMVVRSGILKRMLPLCILTQKSTINQDIKAYTLVLNSLSTYVYYMLKALEPNILFNYTKRVTTVDSLKFDEFSRQMPVPLPPLAEQKRIVARLEELLPLCEKLK